MHALLGQILGNYRVETELAQDTGSFGQIYRATDRHSGTTVALKVLFTDRANNPELRKRFKRECSLAGMLQHPHIIDFYEAGEHNGILYLSMELMPDGSLRSLLQRRESQPWTLRLGLDLIRQAAEGLAYAHSQGIVHRDIKPENLLLRLLEPDDCSGALHADPDEYYYQLKIGDFGVARFRDQTQITQTGFMPGTPAYKSPDHFRMKELDGRSDIYSLGVIFYEIATGAMPYAVDNPDLAMNNILLESPVWPRNLNPDLSPAVERIIMRCLEKNPDHRYQSATDLATAVQVVLDALAGEAVQHVPPPQPTAELLEAEHIHVVPAQNTLPLEINRPTKFSVMVTHLGSQIDTFTVTIEGVPSEWITPASVSLEIDPTQRKNDSAEFTITVPQSPASTAGTYPVTIRAVSQNDQQEYRTAQVQWEIPPFGGNALELVPKEVRARRLAHYQLRLENNGNTATRYKLRGNDDRGALTYTFMPCETTTPDPDGAIAAGPGGLPDQDLPGPSHPDPIVAVVEPEAARSPDLIGNPDSGITLDPGQAQELDLTVDAPWHWFGSNQHNDFRVILDGGSDPGIAQGRFIQSPVIPRWAVTIVPLLLLAMLFMLFGPPLIWDVKVVGATDSGLTAGQPVMVSWRGFNMRGVKVGPTEGPKMAPNGEGTFMRWLGLQPWEHDFTDGFRSDAEVVVSADNLAGLNSGSSQPLAITIDERLGATLTIEPDAIMVGDTDQATMTIIMQPSAERITLLDEHTGTELLEIERMGATDTQTHTVTLDLNPLTGVITPKDYDRTKVSIESERAKQATPFALERRYRIEAATRGVAEPETTRAAISITPAVDFNVELVEAEATIVEVRHNQTTSPTPLTIVSGAQQEQIQLSWEVQGPDKVTLSGPDLAETAHAAQGHKTIIVSNLTEARDLVYILSYNERELARVTVPVVPLVCKVAFDGNGPLLQRKSYYFGNDVPIDGAIDLRPRANNGRELEVIPRSLSPDGKSVEIELVQPRSLRGWVPEDTLHKCTDDTYRGVPVASLPEPTKTPTMTPTPTNTVNVGATNAAVALTSTAEGQITAVVIERTATAAAHQTATALAAQAATAARQQTATALAERTVSAAVQETATALAERAVSAAVQATATALAAQTATAARQQTATASAQTAAALDARTATALAAQTATAARQQTATAATQTAAALPRQRRPYPYPAPSRDDIQLLSRAAQGIWESSQLLPDGHNGTDITELPWQGAWDDPRGFVRLDREVLEDGSLPRLPTLHTHPKWVDDGTIKGWLPWMRLPASRKILFKAEIGFREGAVHSDGVTFWVWLHYIENGREQWTPIVQQWKPYNGELRQVTADLSAYAGQQVQIELRADAGPDASQDWAVWVNPRIVFP